MEREEIKMREKFWKRVLSAFTAVTITVGTLAAFSLPAFAEGEVQGVPQIPEGAINVAGQPSNVTTTQPVTVASDGTKRNVASTTNNSSIWYLGDYDLNDIARIDVRAGMVSGTVNNAETYPEIKFAYACSRER